MFLRPTTTGLTDPLKSALFSGEAIAVCTYTLFFGSIRSGRCWARICLFPSTITSTVLQFFILHPFALILLKIPLLYPGHIARTMVTMGEVNQFSSFILLPLSLLVRPGHGPLPSFRFSALIIHPCFHSAFADPFSIYPAE